MRFTRSIVTLGACMGLLVGLSLTTARSASAICGDGVTTVGEACDAGTPVCQAMAKNAGSECCTEADCGGPISDGAGGLMLLCGCTGGSCNNGVGNRDDIPGACRCNCMKPMCGDGVSDPGESCDPGMTSSTSGPCLGDAPNSVCANAAGTLCLNGGSGNPNAVVACGTDGECAARCGAGFTCSGNPWCRLAQCGDDFVCSDADCISGNSLFGTPSGLPAPEACDDSNTSNNDACTSFGFTVQGTADQCQANFCGDGTTNAPTEECDAGIAVCISGPKAGFPTLNKLCCTNSDCMLGSSGAGICSNAVTNGNSNNPNASCRCGCTVPACGDGISDNLLLEECDDGTTANNPGQFCNKEQRCIGGENGCTDTNTNGRCDSDATENAGRLAAGLCTSSADCVKGTCGKLECAQNTCGDGIVGGMELCDDANTVLANNGPFPSDSCGATATVAGGVNAVLKPGCSTTVGQNLPNACIPALCILPFCSDGVTNSGEMCDGTTCQCSANTFNPGTPCKKITDCKPLPGFVGTDQCGLGQGACKRDDVADRCRSNCMPPTCGDGVSDTGEQCEPPGAGTFCIKNALGLCVLNTCGDDDVCNTTAIDAATKLPRPCSTGPTCDPVTGACTAGGGNEQCDDSNTVNPSPTNLDTCSNICAASVCGDSVTNPGEQCDSLAMGCSNMKEDLRPPEQAFDCCIDGNVVDGSKVGLLPGLISVEQGYTALLGCRLPNLQGQASCNAGLQRAYQRITSRVLASQVRFENNDITRARRMMRSVERRLSRLVRRIARLTAPGKACAGTGTAIANQNANASDLAIGIVAHMTEDGSPFGP